MTPNSGISSPLPQTPPARIRHQPQLTRNRQRSPVRPRRTVQRNPTRRPHRQRPRRRHLRTEPASTELRCRFQPGLCRRVRAPGTEADAHRVPILNHRHNRRPSRNLGSRPPGKVARKQLHFIYEDGGIRLCSTVSGKANAGPEYTSPPASALYRSACTGASRKSATVGSSRARPSSSSAISCGTSARTAQAQLVLPRISANSGPGSGSGSRVPRICPAPSSKNSVRRCRTGVLTGQPERRHCRPPTTLPSQIDRAQQIPHLDRL